MILNKLLPHWRLKLLILNVVFILISFGFVLLAKSGVYVENAVELFRVVQISVVFMSFVLLARGKSIDIRAHVLRDNHEIFRAIKGNDFNRVTQIISKDPKTLLLKNGNGMSPFMVACWDGMDNIVEVITGKYQKLAKDFSDHPEIILRLMKHNGFAGYRAIATQMKQEELLKTTYITAEMHYAFIGDCKSLRPLLTKEKINDLHQGLTLLHYALLGKNDPDTIDLLLEFGSDTNVLCLMENINKNGQELCWRQHLSPLLLAIVLRQEDNALRFFRHNPRVQIKFGDKDQMMLACQRQLILFVRETGQSYTWDRRDQHQYTALDYARNTKNTALIELVEKFIRKEPSSSPNPAPPRPAQQGHPVTLEKIRAEIDQSLSGLVGLADFAGNLAHEIYAFTGSEGEKNKGIIVWGDSSVGKSEFAQRCAGMRKNANIPGLNIPGVDVGYLSCTDSNLDIAKIISSLNKKTILILDEVDKYFSPSSGIVDESQAKRLRSSIVTNFDRLPVLWIFSGTFYDLRGEGNLTEASLTRMLGPELTSRIEFAEWKLPSWTLNSLLSAAASQLNRDAEQLSYDDEAMSILATQALKSKGGVRQLLKYHDYFKRSAAKKQALLHVNKDTVTQYLKLLSEGDS